MLAGMGTVDKGGTPLVGPLRAAVDERRQAPARRRSIGFTDQRCYAASGPARVVCRPGGALVCGVGTVTGHPVNPPARHFTVIPRCGGSVCSGCYPMPEDTRIIGSLHVLKVSGW